MADFDTLENDFDHFDRDQNDREFPVAVLQKIIKILAELFENRNGLFVPLQQKSRVTRVSRKTGPVPIQLRFN